jgi:hypothetical protein
MQKSHILYDNLLSLLNNIIDGVETENYYESLGSQEFKDLFLFNLDNIKKEVDSVRNCKLVKSLYPNYNGLVDFLNSFQDNFPDFPNLRFPEIHLIIYLSQKFAELVEDFEEEEITLIDFEIQPLTSSEFSFNYHYHNADNKKVLFLINFDDLNTLKTAISGMNISALFILHILPLIGGANILNSNRYLISHKDNFLKPKDLKSILRIHLLTKGHVLHTPFSYSSTPLNNYLDDLNVGENYQQFYDIISILSEYNYQKDILDKYLRAYHILENFMFRLPIVNLEALSHGKLFRIRDFRLMYKRVEQSETSALSDLLIEVLKRNGKGGKILKKIIFEKWDSLKTKPDFDVHAINELLKNLRIELGKKKNIAQFTHVKYDNIDTFFKQIVYMTRNAIVHNKETEFHLTHLNLDASKSLVLSDFLIPSIEEIIFNLISLKNNIVWYENSKLLLWDD